MIDIEIIGYPLTNKDPICNLDFIDTDNITINRKIFFEKFG
jgi:hypothetical protein